MEEDPYQSAGDPQVFLKQLCPFWDKNSQGPYSPTILMSVLCLVLQILLYLAAFECNTTSDWPNHTVWPIRSCVTFKFTQSWRIRHRIFLRTVGEYGPRMVKTLDGVVKK